MKLNKFQVPNSIIEPIQQRFNRMASPFAQMQDDSEFIEQSKKDDRSDYVLKQITAQRKVSSAKSQECKIEHTDSINILKQKKHHIHNIGLLHITKGPKNQNTIDKIVGLNTVRFFHEGNIYYPGD